MNQRKFVLVNNSVRQRAIDCIGMAPVGLEVIVKEPTRNAEQNARMWAMLTEVSGQVEWYGKRLTPEDWKHVFSSTLRKLEVVPNIEGTGFVALGLSTSRMSKREMSDLMELIAAFGAERGVVFNDEMVPA